MYKENMYDYFSFSALAYFVVTVLVAPCCFLAIVSDFVVVYV